MEMKLPKKRDMMKDGRLVGMSTVFFPSMGISSTVFF